jgi:hypothetical protein
MIKVTFYCGGNDRTFKPVNVEVDREVMDKAFPGFTQYTAEGSYQGKREPSYVFEVVVGYKPFFDPDKVARELARVGNQSEVMVTTAIVNMHFVSDKG